MHAFVSSQRPVRICALLSAKQASLQMVPHSLPQAGLQGTMLFNGPHKKGPLGPFR